MTPVDPRELTPMPTGDAGLKGDVIYEERACAGCGYSLLGLRLGQPCPECGRPITISNRAHTARKPSNVVAQLVDAPIGYIRLTHLGFLSMTFATLLALFAGVSLFASSIGFGGGARAPALLLVASLLWVGGLALVMRPRPLLDDAPRKIETEWWMLRLVTLLTQSAFVLGAAVVALAAPPASAPGGLSAGGSAPALSGAMLAVAMALACIGAAGWIPTMVLLARYADWTAYEELGWRLRYAAMGMGVTAPVIAVMETVVPRTWDVYMLYRVFSLFMYILLLASLGMFLWSSFSLSVTCSRAAVIARTRRSADQRLVDRMRAEAEAHMRSVAQQPELRPPDSFHPVGTARNAGKSSLGKSGAPARRPPAP